MHISVLPQKQLTDAENREFRSLLQTSLADPSAFFKRIREKRIRLPTGSGSVDVDTARIAMILHRHGVLGAVQSDIESLTAARYGRENFPGEAWAQRGCEGAQPMQYDKGKTTAIQEAFACEAESEHACRSLMTAEEAERRRDAAEKRRKEIYDEIAALMAGVEKGFSSARNEYFRSTTSTLRGADVELKKFFKSIRKEIEVAPEKPRHARTATKGKDDDDDVSSPRVAKADKHKAGGKKKRQ